MTGPESDVMMLSRLVGSWQGTLRYRAGMDEPMVEVSGTSENRWVLNGRFVEMTLRAGDSWSAVVYIGYEQGVRRHVLVSLEPGDRRAVRRRGEWTLDNQRLVLTSERSRVVCDMNTPGELIVQLFEESASGREFVRFKAEYRLGESSALTGKPSSPRQHRRFVIA